MTLVEDFEPKARAIDKYKAEVSAFVESGGRLCLAERYTKNVINDYSNYKKAIWMLGLQDKLKPMIRKDKVYLWRRNA